MWYCSSQYSALATRKLRTSRRPKSKTKVPQSGCSPRRGSACSYSDGAVEPAQRPFVLGEVRRHPVQDDADAGLVQPVDQVPQVVRDAEPGVRGVVRGHLVAPGRRERVAGQRQELDVGEPGLGQLGDQLVGHLPVVQALLQDPAWIS